MHFAIAEDQILVRKSVVRANYEEDQASTVPSSQASDQDTSEEPDTASQTEAGDDLKYSIEELCRIGMERSHGAAPLPWADAAFDIMNNGTPNWASQVAGTLFAA